jgi:SAM-dependent methyltransferase
VREIALHYLVCPACQSEIRIERVEERESDQIKEGSLICSTGQHLFKITRFIPRFLSGDHYTSSFGFEWNQHVRTQLDSMNGMRLSEERFFRQTNWPHDLSGQTVLEVGSGAGRFTEIALQTGALVISVDASAAVDANWNNNGRFPNLILCQASLYELPLKPATLDKVFCFGVLQHTPDVARAFKSIARFPRPGGELAVDVYNKKYWKNYHTPIYLIRPLTKHIPHDRLYRWVSWAVPRLIPLSSWLDSHVPIIGRHLSALVPISNYQGLLPTSSQELIRQYSILDTFDTLSPVYISPQRPSVVYQWFFETGYEQIEFNRKTVFSMRARRRA